MTKKQQPLVSVFIPTYNHQEFIKETLESALTQDYPNFEIICGDDASTDDTQKILKQYQKQYPDKIKLILHKKNLGVTLNCNSILEACNGKYIAMFAGDDLMLYNRISKVVSAFEENTNMTICYHDCEIFDSPTNKKIYMLTDVAKPPTKSAASLLKKGTFFTGPCVSVRADIAKKIKYDERIKIMSDFLFFIELAAHGEIGYIPEMLSRYRRHPNNASNKKNYYDEYFLTLAIVRDKYPKLAKYTNPYEASLFKAKMIRLFESKQYDDAFYCSNECLIRFHQPYFFLPISILGLFRVGILKSIIDSTLSKAILFAKGVYKKLQKNYKVYEEK